MEKARGRPAKKRPKVPPEAVTAVKIMVKTQHGYEGAKKRSEYYPLKRPSLMRRLKVDTNDYESTGKIEYDRELVKRIHENDQRYIRQYERDMELIWIIEHGVSSIPDERTRRIAECDQIHRKNLYGLEVGINRTFLPKIIVWRSAIIIMREGRQVRSS